MAIEAFKDARVAAAKEAQAKAQVEARKKAIANLVTYLERKWKQPRNEIWETVTASFALTTKSSASRSQQDWPQPLDILAVVQVESGFNRQARDSQSGSVGLMQINTDDHHISIEKLTKPATSISYGLALLYKYRREMQSESRALVAYNQGPISAQATCGKRKHCETPYTLRVALAKQELTRHFQ
jgi:soluble lytic murein transglycosylase-like protein